MSEAAEELQKLRTVSKDAAKASLVSCGYCNSNCVRKQLRRRLHIVNWITSYDKEDMISDLIAGITLGLTIIPQSIAYAAIAGLPSQYGLYAAFMGEF